MPHPTALPSIPDLKVWVTVDHANSLGQTASTNIWYGVGAPASRFVLPSPPEAIRADELWKTTCFEAFFQPVDGEEYREWNFAPSGSWAAYDFDGYRSAPARAEVQQPYIRFEDNLIWWATGATVATPAASAWRLGLSAVLEEEDGRKTYWALAHPDPEKPDFHHADCFVAKLA